jgi:hypothetical protein
MMPLLLTKRSKLELKSKKYKNTSTPMQESFSTVKMTEPWETPQEKLVF